MQPEKFSVRPLTKNDLHPFFSLIERNRSRLEAFFAGTVARTRSFSDAEVYLEEIVTKSEQKIYLPFLITDAEERMAGFVDIKNIDWNIPKGELGFFMDNEFAGKGESKEILSRFVDYCFSELKFNKLFLRTHSSNIAARRLAEGCGFLLEGTLRSDYKTSEGELVDLLYYGKVSDD